jgi:hypothetical protein
MVLIVKNSETPTSVAKGVVLICELESEVRKFTRLRIRSASLTLRGTLNYKYQFIGRRTPSTVEIHMTIYFV